MPEFTATRNRDAWFVIRGYKYQIDLTILRWLGLAADQLLVLESGEDIDIVNTALSKGPEEFDRTLEQIKHLDASITLRAPPVKIAIANAVQHRTSNPALRLSFRFCTNASITSERPSPFEDRAPGIGVWEKLRTNIFAEPERSRRLTKLLAFLRKLKKPSEGIDPATWTNFTSFATRSSIDDLDAFIASFEWAFVEPNNTDISAEIQNRLASDHKVPQSQAHAAYSRLFLQVVQLLSQKGPKQLARATLESALANPANLSQSDSTLLAFIQNQVLLHSAQLERLESASRTNEHAVVELRDRLMELAYGPAWSVNLSAAVAEIATSLPPQVRPIAKRSAALEEIKSLVRRNDWVAIYGSVGCGKTQLATLLGDHIQPIVYVSLRDLSPIEANFLLHHLFLQLCADKRTGSITRSGLVALEIGTTLIFDDLPRVNSGDQLTRRLAEIASSVQLRNQHLVTLSHHPIPPAVSTSKGIGKFTEIVAPRLNQDDVLELLNQRGAPAQVLTATTASAFLTATSGNPTLLAAMVRALERQSWKDVEVQLSEVRLAAAVNDVVSEATFRLLVTVEDESSRELLYRLCVILGSFGSPEVELVSQVQPHIPRPAEKHSSLQGLWIEKQSFEQSVVCPLIATSGKKQLVVSVERDVANALADAIFERIQLSPIDFAKGVQYFRRAENGVSLGLCIFGALGSVSDLPLAWKRIVLSATMSEGLLEICPRKLALLVKSKQIQLAASIKEPLSELIKQGRELLAHAHDDEMWAAVSYAMLAAPFVAKVDFDEAVSLHKLIFSEFATVVEFQDSMANSARETVDQEGLQADEIGGSFAWFLVHEIKSVANFLKWFDLITSQPEDRVSQILSCDLAPMGMRLAADLLWMVQHTEPESQQNFEPVLAAYETAAAYFGRNQHRLLHAIVVRAQIIVFAEYLHNLQVAKELSESFLASGPNDNEILFLINSCVGSQCLYAREISEAITRHKLACDLHTEHFNGIKCRAFIELSSAIGESDHDQALDYAEKAVTLAEKNPREVPELDMVSALGEASLAAWHADKAGIAFDHLDKAFAVMARSFEETVDWKMRRAILGSLLSYMATTSSTGSPPDDNPKLVPRGRLISYNEILAQWYDSRGDAGSALECTLLVVFASSVDRAHRALFWANRGIDEAREKGILPSVHRLAEALVPNLLTLGDFERALDYAYESLVALVGSHISYRSGQSDVRESKDAGLLLGEKPSEDWNQIERLFVWNGVVPSLVVAITRDNPVPTLEYLSASCMAMASDASNPAVFRAISVSLDDYLLKRPGAELNARALAASRSHNNAVAAVVYLLSSFAEDTSRGQAIIQHALVLHNFALQLGESITWSFVADRLAKYWIGVFEAQKFAFLNPREIAMRIIETTPMTSAKRIRRVLLLMMAGLNVNLPRQLETTSDWLKN